MPDKLKKVEHFKMVLGTNCDLNCRNAYLSFEQVSGCCRSPFATKKVETLISLLSHYSASHHIDIRGHFYFFLLMHEI